MSSEQYQKLTQLEHVHKNPDVWGAVAKLSTITDWIIDNDHSTLIQEELQYVPLLLKMFDEVLVNAIDQHTRYPEVTTIVTNYDRETRTISVYNNGRGIPIELHEKHDMYIPQLVFCEFLSGSNFERKVDKTTGGKNGIGAKLTNAFSREFIIETSSNGKYYKQIVEKCMSVVNPPEIKEWQSCKSSLRQEMTKITFRPNYKKIGYAEFTDVDADILDRLLYTRLVFASVYTGLSMKYNDKKIRHSLLSMSKLAVSESQPLSIVVRDTHEWEILIYPSDSFKHISLINGIYVGKGGTHISYILTKLLEHCKEKCQKILGVQKVTRAMIEKYIFVFVKCPIEDPQFNSQAKEELTSPTKFSFDITEKDAKKFFNMIKPYLELQTKLKEQDTTRTKKSRIKAEKYESAEYAGTRQASKCALFIPEGDSAFGFVRRGLTSRDTKLGGLSYYGIFSMQGKPMNARRETSTSLYNGARIRIRSRKLKENERWSSLVQVLGLDYTYTYEDNEEGNLAFSKLRYGRVIVAVDQDSDGVGHIFGLILNFFHVFWPALIRRGYISRLATPIIRAYSKKKSTGDSVSFYNDAEFESWLSESRQQRYTIKYFKGLATHSDKEVVSIFKGMQDQLFTYDLDDKSDELFDVYFGKESAGRKVELKQPLVAYKPVNMKITCTQQLQYETKEYQRDHIIRSLPHIIDGLRPASRSILAGIRKELGRDETRKIFQLGGVVANAMQYHHGDASLNNNIVRMAQKFPGARNLPLLRGVGNFGSRSFMGDDAGQPRYIEAGLNHELVNALFPQVDEIILDYNYVDGKKCEPLYYVPVLPLSIMETYGTPATGWRTEVFARHYEDVIETVTSIIRSQRMNTPITLPKTSEMTNMRFWMPYNKSDVVEEEHRIEIRGHLKRVGDEVFIDEMPPFVADSLWREEMMKRDEIDDIINNSSDTTIDIKVKFRKGTLDSIIDTFRKAKNIPSSTSDEEVLLTYLKVYYKQVEILNFLDIDFGIAECNSYQEVILRWFVVRQKLYELRIARRKIILSFIIVMYENMVRYAANSSKYNLSGASENVAIAKLEEEKYRKCNRYNIEHPLQTKDNEQLEKFLSSDESFNYLLDLSDRQKLETANNARIATLEEYKRELELLNKPDKYFIGAHIWLSEIEHAREIIKKGMENNWN